MIVAINPESKILIIIDLIKFFSHLKGVLGFWWCYEWLRLDRQDLLIRLILPFMWIGVGDEQKDLQVW